MASIGLLTQLLKIILLALSFTLAISKDYICPDTNPVKVGSAGPILRSRIIGKVCQAADDTCEQKFNISLPRGEMYRNQKGGIDMRHYGSEVCVRNTKVTKGTEGRHTEECQSRCYLPSASTNRLLRLPNEGYENCTITNGSKTCTLGGTKSYWDITVTKINLATEGPILAKEQDMKCPPWQREVTPMNKNSVTLTFEDCLQMMPSSDAKDRCDKANIYVNGAVENSFYIKEGTKKIGIAMLGSDTHFQASFRGDDICIGASMTTKMMIHDSKNSPIREEEFERCKKSCKSVRTEGWLIGSDPHLELVYYQESFKEALKTDSNVTKYIKVKVQFSGSSGAFYKSEPIFVFCLLLIDVVYIRLI